jgi:DNA repair exonuclease SbcCD nuclease subunit
MKSLIIGDPHFKVSNLDDCRSFVRQTLEIVQKDRPENVIILGDLFNDFAVIRSEVLKLWSEFFHATACMSKVICLVGNHDMAGADGGTYPMEPFKTIPNVTIVDALTKIDGIYYMPFVRDNAEFEKQVRSIAPDSVVFCHQSFNGATFENGFYDPHGADPDSAIHLGAVICGHIHKRQTLGNIWYPGTPFQHTFGDAGQEKSIIMINLHKNCYTIEKEYQLDMPKFYEIRGNSIEEVKDLIHRIKDCDLDKGNFKIIAHGSPAEIAAFWQEDLAKSFRSLARRVVDAMTSIKPLNEKNEIKGQSRKEKLDEYIKAKEWRTDSDRIARRAREYFTV